MRSLFLYNKQLTTMTFNPQPKPIKKEKKNPKGYWVSGRCIQMFEAPQTIKNKSKNGLAQYRTSDGKLMTDPQIKRRLSKEYKLHPQPGERKCECCGDVMAEHHDHTISQRQCKLLKIVEMIWSVLNWSLSCAKCHKEWESYKSGLFQHHNNLIQRMLFMKKYDKEGFNKRIHYITDRTASNTLLS